MSTHSNKAILIVCFGTAHTAARLRTLDAIEADIRTAFPDYPVYTAWTGSQLIARLKKEDGILVDTVSESLYRMKSDGITDVIIQPAFTIPGMEYAVLWTEVSACAKLFASIRIEKPLLSDETALPAVATAIISEFPDLSSNEALIFMGHGTASHGTAAQTAPALTLSKNDCTVIHPVTPNHIYIALEQTFRQSGLVNVFVGAMNGEPSLGTIIPRLDSLNPRKVILAPLMITAGSHAVRDLSGDSPDSWKSRLMRAGFSVECVMKGLGEYEAVRRLFVRNTALNI